MTYLTIYELKNNLEIIVVFTLFLMNRKENCKLKSMKTYINVKLIIHLLILDLLWKNT